MLIVQLDSQQLSDLIQTAVRKAISETPTQTPQPEPEKPLTVREAAKYLTLSVPTVYSLISKGELPVKKRSKRCYFFASDLNNYLKAGGKKIAIKEVPEKELPGDTAESLKQKKVLTSKSNRKND